MDLAQLIDSPAVQTRTALRGAGDTAVILGETPPFTLDLPNAVLAKVVSAQLAQADPVQAGGVVEDDAVDLAATDDSDDESARTDVERSADDSAGSAAERIEPDPIPPAVPLLIAGAVPVQTLSAPIQEHSAKPAGVAVPPMESAAYPAIAMPRQADGFAVPAQPMVHGPHAPVQQNAQPMAPPKLVALAALSEQPASPSSDRSARYDGTLVLAAPHAVPAPPVATSPNPSTAIHATPAPTDALLPINLDQKVTSSSDELAFSPLTGGEISPRLGAIASNAALPGPAEQVRAQHVAAQLVSTMTRAEGDKMELRLDPPELGRVLIQLHLRDGEVSAMITTERAETADLMRRHMDVLARELARAGLAGAEMTFRSQGDSSGRGDHPTHAQPHNTTSSGQSLAGLQVNLAVRNGLAADGSLDIRL